MLRSSATTGAGFLRGYTAARDHISEVATCASGIDSELAISVANWLLAASGINGVGLTAYGLYGWWQSKKTVE